MTEVLVLWPSVLLHSLQHPPPLLDLVVQQLVRSSASFSFLSCSSSSASESNPSLPFALVVICGAEGPGAWAACCALRDFSARRASIFRMVSMSSGIDAEVVELNLELLVCDAIDGDIPAVGVRHDGILQRCWSVR